MEVITNLGYELSKYKRNNVGIVSYLSNLLHAVPVSLEVYVNNMEDSDEKEFYIDFYNKAKKVGLTNHFNERFIVFHLDTLNKDVLVALDMAVEDFMSDLVNSEAYKYCNDGDSYVCTHKLLYTFARTYFCQHKYSKPNVEHIAIYCSYDKFGMFCEGNNELWFEYKYMCHLLKFIELGINDKLAEFLCHRGISDLVTSHLLYGDGFEYVKQEIEDELKVADNEDLISDLELSLMFLDNYLNSERPCNELAHLAMFKCSDIMYRRGNFLRDDEKADIRHSTLYKWSRILSDDRDVIYIKYKGNFSPLFKGHYRLSSVGASMPESFVVNVVKDLPKLLLFVYSLAYDNSEEISESDISNLVPDYISKDSSKFRRPYDLYNGEFFADGNLSKVRAVKKFISAVEKLGMNLSDFHIEIE